MASLRRLAPAAAAALATARRRAAAADAGELRLLLRVGRRLGVVVHLAARRRRLAERDDEGAALWVDEP